MFLLRITGRIQRIFCVRNYFRYSTGSWRTDRIVIFVGTVEKISLRKPAGRRKAGRPKLRWLDCTENDMKSMCVTRRAEKAEYISVWAIILKEALVKL